MGKFVVKLLYCLTLWDVDAMKAEVGTCLDCYLI